MISHWDELLRQCMERGRIAGRAARRHVLPRSNEVYLRGVGSTTRVEALGDWDGEE